MPFQPSLHPFPTPRQRLNIHPSERASCFLTGLRIRASFLVTHFVLLNPTMRLLVRAGCVAISKHSERMGGRVLLGEILCNINLSTYC